MDVDNLAEALEQIEAGRADGVEVASAALPSCRAILLVALVRVPGEAAWPWRWAGGGLALTGPCRRPRRCC